MKLFAVVANRVDAQRENQFTEHLRQYGGLGWWHHFPSTWLVADSVGYFTTESLAELARTLLQVEVLTFAVDGRRGNWVGYFAHGPASEWLTRYFMAE